MNASLGSYLAGVAWGEGQVSGKGTRDSVQWREAQ